MADKLNEAAKKLGQTKRNSEAALRRYAPKHPKIERTRDIFDEIVPFEMEFETDRQDSTMDMDLYFNKPPPMKGCREGQFISACDDFVTTVGDGSHLLQVGSSYWPGTVSVYVNDVALTSSQFSEYSPAEGLVYVVGTTEPQNISICFLTNSWNYVCDESTDPLVGTILNTGLLGANQSDPELPVAQHPYALRVDTDPSTIYPSAGFYSTTKADYSVYIDYKAGLFTWTAHLEDFANLPQDPGLPFIRADGTLFFDETPPRVIDMYNCKITMGLHNYSGAHITEELDFFTQAPESANVNINFGTGFLTAEIQTLYGDRNFGQSAGTGAGRPPRSLIRFLNFGNRDYLGNVIVDGTTATPWAEYGFNEPIGISARIHRKEGYINIIAAGYSFIFDNPRFQSFGVGPGVTIDWSTRSYLIDTSDFYLSISNVTITPCGYVPDI